MSVSRACFIFGAAQAALMFFLSAQAGALAQSPHTDAPLVVPSIGVSDGSTGNDTEQGTVELRTSGNAKTTGSADAAPLTADLPATLPGSTIDSAGAQSSPADAASSNAPATSSATGSSSKSGGFGHILKSNIVETFELDPRLKKDLTEGNPALRPIKLMQDYFAVGYNPVIEWHRDNGPPWLTDYAKTNMSCYIVGPITKHFSAWVQPLPLVNNQGFFQHLELFQGLANYGGDKTFVQIQGGQGFNFENAGWGGADRTITQTFPGVYTAFNGFDPTATAKTISLSATGLNWTTGKIFGYWEPAAATSSDPNIYYYRDRGLGLSFEKLIGKTGISGIQSYLTMGNTPALNGNLNAIGNVIGQQQSKYVQWTSWFNKSFQDRKGFVRLNPSFGLTVLHQKRYLDDPSVPENPTTAYGYTFDLVAIPVLSYWTTVLRYDQYKPTRLASNNTTYTFTIGQALDFHLPNKAKLRVTFDYQLVGQHTMPPSQRIYLGFWPIW